MSSSRRTPVNPEVWTYGSAVGRDYGEGEFANFQADKLSDRDLVGDEVSPVLQVFKDQASYADVLHTSVNPPASISSTYRPYIIGMDKEDKPLFCAPGNENYTVNFCNYLCIHDIEAENIYTGGDTYASAFGFDIGGASYSEAIGCVVRDISSNQPGGHAIGFHASVGTGNKIVNCTVEGTLTAGASAYRLAVDFEGSADGNYLYNTTIKSVCDIGFLILDAADAGRVHTAKNCICQTATMMQFAALDGTLSPSSVASWTKVTCAESGVTFEADGITPAEADTVALDQGTNLSADPVFAFDDDLIGTTRPQGSAWDIGAVEVVIAAPTTIASTTVSPTTLNPTTSAPEERRRGRRNFGFSHRSNWRE